MIKNLTKLIFFVVIEMNVKSKDYCIVLIQL
jgi:hypothetical protein